MNSIQILLWVCICPHHLPAYSIKSCCSIRVPLSTPDVCITISDSFIPPSLASVRYIVYLTLQKYCFLLTPAQIGSANYSNSCQHCTFSEKKPNKRGWKRIATWCRNGGAINDNKVWRWPNKLTHSHLPPLHHLYVKHVWVRHYISRSDCMKWYPAI